MKIVMKVLIVAGTLALAGVAGTWTGSADAGRMAAEQPSQAAQARQALVGLLSTSR